MDWKESDARKSPKVREIVGQMPPVLARYGIAVIIGSLLMTAFVFAVMPYHPKLSVRVKRTVKTDSIQIVYTAVPYELYRNFPLAFSNIHINTDPTEYILLSITSIEDEENDDPQALIKLYGENPIHYQSDSAIMVLHLGKVSLLSWMIGKNYFEKTGIIINNKDYAP